LVTIDDGMNLQSGYREKSMRRELDRLTSQGSQDYILGTLPKY